MHRLEAIIVYTYNVFAEDLAVLTGKRRDESGAASRAYFSADSPDAMSLLCKSISD